MPHCGLLWMSSIIRVLSDQVNVKSVRGQLDTSTADQFNIKSVRGMLLGASHTNQSHANLGLARRVSASTPYRNH